MISYDFTSNWLINNPTVNFFNNKAHNNTAKYAYAQSGTHLNEKKRLTTYLSATNIEK